MPYNRSLTTRDQALVILFSAAAFLVPIASGASFSFSSRGPAAAANNVDEMFFTLFARLQEKFAFPGTCFSLAKLAHCSETMVYNSCPTNQVPCFPNY
jgi:hypothetical protein